MGFWSGLFGGANPTLSTNIGNFGSIGGFATNLGEKNITQSSKFWSDILSGDATKQMQALAPEVSAAKTAAAQDRKTTTELGTRSGGTAASNATSTDKVHSAITDLLGRLTGTAATSLGSTGSSLLTQGMEAFDKQTELSQEQLENWSNSIAGLGLTKGIGFLEGFGLSKV